MKRVWTDEMIDYVKSICYGKNGYMIADSVTAKFGIKITYAQVHSLMSRLYIHSGKSIPRHKRMYSDDMIQWAKENRYGHYIKEFTQMFNEHFGTDFKVSQIDNMCTNHKINSGLTGYFPKGHIPPNKGKKGVYTKGSEKGWFKPGHKPHNYHPVGTALVDNKDGYIKIKTADPDVWEFKHRLVWKEHHSGQEIPDDCVIMFLDGNKYNFDPDNLKLVPRGVITAMNKENLYASGDPDVIKCASAYAQIKHRIKALEKKNKDK